MDIWAGIRPATALASAVLAAGAAAQGPDPVAPEQLFERLAPSVWTVETFDARKQPLGMGSAVVIGPGNLVTNCHVLAKASQVAVARDNVSYGATLEHPDPERDLCILKVRNFNAPPVAVGDIGKLKIGSRVYAIGSPRGLEQTISDGLLSGVRRSSSGDFTALQITVPISKGSSGGGLFDASGRLIGITTFQLRDAQNVNFALPASWIAEVPQRAAAALAARSDSSKTAATTSGNADLVGRAYEYRLTDRTTGNSQAVTYQVDRVDGDKLLLNGGNRVERKSGEVLNVGSAVGGEADASMPPGGWFRTGATVGSSWNLKYNAPAQSRPMRLDLQARVGGQPVLKLASKELETLQIEFTGYVDRDTARPGGATGRYKATAWYAPELGRIVRFEVYARGAYFLVDEQLELVAIR
jgi:serine protease Do